MNGATGKSPDSTSRSAASDEICALFARRTAESFNHRAIVTPWREASASISMRDPATMTRVGAAVCRASNDNRSLSVDPSAIAATTANFRKRENGICVVRIVSLRAIARRQSKPGATRGRAREYWLNAVVRGTYGTFRSWDARQRKRPICAVLAQRCQKYRSNFSELLEKCGRSGRVFHSGPYVPPQTTRGAGQLSILERLAALEARQNQAATRSSAPS
jgi:hypothetical protein